MFQNISKYEKIIFYIYKCLIYTVPVVLITSQNVHQLSKFMKKKKFIKLISRL